MYEYMRKLAFDSVSVSVSESSEAKLNTFMVQTLQTKPFDLKGVIGTCNHTCKEILNVRHLQVV